MLTNERNREIIDSAWQLLQNGVENFVISDDLVTAIDSTLSLLGAGTLRVAEKINGNWVTNNWLKKALLLSFRVYANQNQTTDIPSFDKIPLKFRDWQPGDFEAAKIRLVPGSIVRQGAYLGAGVVLMPSFVNVGAYIDKGTMIDTWSTVGSCAQIGKNCHISGGVGIGGVLEPIQSNPVIIEDDCFIGARSEIAEGVIVEQGCVISMGVFIGASTKIIHRETGEIFHGRVPPYSVVVPGVMPAATPNSPQLACAVIVKQVDAQTRSKTSLNDLLRMSY